MTGKKRRKWIISNSVSVILSPNPLYFLLLYVHELPVIYVLYGTTNSIKSEQLGCYYVCHPGQQSPNFPAWQTDGEGEGMVLCEQQEMGFARECKRPPLMQVELWHACTLTCCLCSLVPKGPWPDSGLQSVGWGPLTQKMAIGIQSTCHLLQDNTMWRRLPRGEIIHS